MPARCFVISPIGAEGSPAREHADNVFEFIIRPAVEECGVDAVRSDHLHEPGKISEQMFREISTSDCCIALLTGFNPNVFYELAVAHVIETPAVLLLEKGPALPFDVHDLRCVRYDLSDLRSLVTERRYSREVAGHLRSLAAAGWRAPPAFGNLPGRRLAKSSLPPELVAELNEDWLVKRSTLTPRQLELLAILERKCGGGAAVSQAELMALSGRAGESEVYYRMECLRLLGFAERGSENYALTPGYRAALPAILARVRRCPPSSSPVRVPAPPVADSSITQRSPPRPATPPPADPDRPE